MQDIPQSMTKAEAEEVADLMAVVAPHALNELQGEGLIETKQTRGSLWDRARRVRDLWTSRNAGLFEEQLVDAMRDLYEHMVTGARVKGFDFSADLMAHWLGNTDKFGDPGSMVQLTEAQMEALLSDEQVLSDLQNNLDNLAGNNQSGTLDNATIGVNTTPGTDLYYGLGKVTLTFSGDFSREPDGSLVLEGIIVATDLYDWDPNQTNTINGVEIPQAWADWLGDHGGAWEFAAGGVTAPDFTLDLDGEDE